MKLNRKSIWNEAQNKPSQIVEDLSRAYTDNESGLTLQEWRHLIYETLLRRGVFKWLGVRRSLIKLKNKWKEDIKAFDEERKKAIARGDRHLTSYCKGYKQALEDCRKEVRALCHSDRWQCPDHDSKAKQWLEKYELPDGCRIVEEVGKNGTTGMWTFQFIGEGPSSHVFPTPELAVMFVLAFENNKNNNEWVRRATASIGRGDPGYDANGSPVPAMRRWPLP